MACNTNLALANNILRDCDQTPVKGLFDEVVIINYDDVDWSQTQINAENLQVTDLVLKTGKTGFKISGAKDLHKVSFEMKDGTFGKVYTHKYNGVALRPDANTWRDVFRLVNSNVIVVAHRKYGKTGDGAFIVLGLDLGLTGTAHTYDSAANDGLVQFELATPAEDNAGETKPPMTLWEGTYEATKTAFDNGFKA